MNVKIMHITYINTHTQPNNGLVGPKHANYRYKILY